MAKLVAGTSDSAIQPQRFSGKMAIKRPQRPLRHKGAHRKARAEFRLHEKKRLALVDVKKTTTYSKELNVQ
jgi:hypothetical protein